MHFGQFNTQSAQIPLDNKSYVAPTSQLNLNQMYTAMNTVDSVQFMDDDRGSVGIQNANSEQLPMFSATFSPEHNNPPSTTTWTENMVEMPTMDEALDCDMNYLDCQTPWEVEQTLENLIKEAFPNVNPNVILKPYRNMSGLELLQMNERKFVEIDPRYGAWLYNAIKHLKLDELVDPSSNVIANEVNDFISTNTIEDIETETTYNNYNAESPSFYEMYCVGTASEEEAIDNIHRNYLEANNVSSTVGNKMSDSDGYCSQSLYSNQNIYETPRFVQPDKQFYNTVKEQMPNVKPITFPVASNGKTPSNYGKVQQQKVSKTAKSNYLGTFEGREMTVSSNGVSSSTDGKIPLFQCLLPASQCDSGFSSVDFGSEMEVEDGNCNRHYTPQQVSSPLSNVSAFDECSNDILTLGSEHSVSSSVSVGSDSPPPPRGGEGDGGGSNCRQNAGRGQPAGRGRPAARGRPTGRGRPANERGNHLWEFLLAMLKTEENNPVNIQWQNKGMGIFRILRSEDTAKLWGYKKNNEAMTYEKMSRALRYYYQRHVGKMIQTDGRRMFRFGNTIPWERYYSELTFDLAEAELSIRCEVA